MFGDLDWPINASRGFVTIGWAFVTFGEHILWAACTFILAENLAADFDSERSQAPPETREPTVPEARDSNICQGAKKVKLAHLILRHLQSWTAALYNLRSGSWLAMTQYRGAGSGSPEPALTGYWAHSCSQQAYYAPVNHARSSPRNPW